MAARSSTAFRAGFSLADTPEYGSTEELGQLCRLESRRHSTDDSQNRIGFAYTDTDRENIDPGSPVPPDLRCHRSQRALGISRHAARSTTAQRHLRPGIGTLGAEHRARPPTFDPNPAPLGRRRADSTALRATDSDRRSTALTLSAGMRYDDHDTFGDDTTARASAAWSVDAESTIVRASYGEGFKAPTLFQLYSQFGNVDLDPEEARKLGCRHRAAFARMTSWCCPRPTSVATRSNMIDFVSCFGVEHDRGARRGLIGYYDNVQKTECRRRRARARSHSSASGCAFYANYTRHGCREHAPRQRTSAASCRAVPTQTANARAQLRVADRPDDDRRGQHAGRSFDNAANTVVLDGYTLVDSARLIRGARRRWKCTAASRTRSTRSTKPSRATARRAARSSAACVRASRAMSDEQRAPISRPGRFAHHGGRLCVARSLFPNVPQPWIDLSTGINPRSYPAPRASLASAIDCRSPRSWRDWKRGRRSFRCRRSRASRCDRRHGDARCGCCRMIVKSRAAVIARTDLRLARGRMDTRRRDDANDRRSTRLRDARADAPVAMTIVSPNNPDGRIVDREQLQSLHGSLSRARRSADRRRSVRGRGAANIASPTCRHCRARRGMVVLRSFGKFYGLAGVRLGFVIASPPIATRLRELLGDWPVSVDAIVAGLAAYADHALGRSERASRSEPCCAAAGQAARAAAATRSSAARRLYRLARATGCTRAVHATARHTAFWFDRSTSIRRCCASACRAAAMTGAGSPLR